MNAMRDKESSPNSKESSVDPNDAMLEYRSIYTGAILGLLLGLLSIAILFVAGTDLQRTLMLIPIPLAGVFVSISALRTIAAAREVYTGENFAKIGLSLSLLFLIGGVSYSSFIYATEVPDGYARTSFLEMKPSESDFVNRDVIPDEIKDLLGKPVFLKGYIRPDSIKYKQNFDNFLLVRDNQECCFGDASKVKFFDQVNIQLDTGMTADYHPGLFRIGGVLAIGPGDPTQGTPLTYKIKADYLKQ